MGMTVNEQNVRLNLSLVEKLHHEEGVEEIRHGVVEVGVLVAHHGDGELVHPGHVMAPGSEGLELPVGQEVAVLRRLERVVPLVDVVVADEVSVSRL